MFDETEQQMLVNNIYLTGGCSQIPGIAERLKKEMLEMRPFQSTFNITIANDPSMSAWLGAKKFASNNENLQNYQITRSEYDEKGGEIIKDFYASNIYYQTAQFVQNSDSSFH